MANSDKINQLVGSLRTIHEAELLARQYVGEVAQTLQRLEQDNHRLRNEATADKAALELVADWYRNQCATALELSALSDPEDWAPCIGGAEDLADILRDRGFDV